MWMEVIVIASSHDLRGGGDLKRLRDALTLFILLMAGVPSALTATRLSLPSIPDFRLPSAGAVNTVFPAATGGAAPYTYSLSGQPPGISFSAGSRRASGTLPTVTTETTYTVTYSVSDGAGASASVSFRATVVPPPAPPPPPPPPLSLPTIPDFRLPSGGVVNTVFPEATGGSGWYFYSASDLPPGISFSAGTRVASGTLPTVATDTTYTVTYSVSDSLYATASVTFSVVVTAATAPPPDPPTSDPGTLTLPFTATETGAGRTEYRFRLDSSTEVSVSLTGMNRDIDCSVNGSRCTNRGGTRDDSWTGTLAAGTHTVTVYPYNAVSGNWTLSVSGRAISPPPTGPTSTPSPPTTDSGPIVKTGVNVSGSRTYPLTLSHRAEVSVELTGMTADFDCTVSGNPCSNRGGTANDSWSGSLNAGEHKIVVYPYGGGAGNYTLTVSAAAPGTGGSSGTRTQVTTLVKASQANTSTSRTYDFTLVRGARVDVALTNLTIDFDCRVGTSRCTNRWGTRDDSWSGDLAQGNHSVVVYPYDPGPGDYSLTVTATETLAFVSTPLAGGPIRLRVCEKDSGGVDTDIVVPGSCVEVVIPGGEGNPDDDDDNNDDGTLPGGGPTQPSPTRAEMDSTARDDATARARNPTCRQFFRRHGELDIVGRLAGVSFDDSDSANQCSDIADAAYTERDGNDTIYTCDLFYDGSRFLRADTVLHEMLHLVGKRHEDLGGPGPFHQAVMSNCP